MSLFFDNASGTIRITSNFTNPTTVKGIGIPTLTTAERNAIASPYPGLLIYNSTTEELNMFTTGWTAVGGGSTSLSLITPATTGNTINNNNNEQRWNWQLTANGQNGFTFGENLASTSGLGASNLLQIETITGSNANPLLVRARSNDALRVGPLGNIAILTGTAGGPALGFLESPTTGFHLRTVTTHPGVGNQGLGFALVGSEAGFINNNGAFVQGRPGAFGPTPSSTDGWMYISSLTAPPTSTPVSFTNKSPLTIDTASNTLYFHNGTSWVGVTAGSGVPGGSNTHVQFNNSGVFGGSANFTWDNATSVLTINGRTDLRQYTESYATPTISGGSLTLDLATASVFRVSLNQNVTTLTINNPASSGRVSTFTLIFTADGTPRTIVWPGSILWPNSIPPTPAVSNGAEDVYTFTTYNGGTTWYGLVAGQLFNDSQPIAPAVVRLDQILAATNPNTINNTNNQQSWRWTLFGTNNGLDINETAPSAGTGSLLNINSLAASTVNVFNARAQNGNGGITINNIGSVIINSGTTNPTFTTQAPFNIATNTGFTTSSSLTFAALAPTPQITTQTGTNITMATGNATVAGNGPSLTFTAGNALTGGIGGGVTITAGNAAGTNQNGGTVQISAGVPTGAGTSNIVLRTNNTTRMTINAAGNVIIPGLLDIVQYIETSPTVAITSGTLTLDLTTGTFFNVSLSQNITTLTFNGIPASGKVSSITIMFTMDGTPRTVAWPPSVRWAGGTAPTLSSIAGRVDIITLITRDGGANWFGVVTGQNYF